MNWHLEVAGVVAGMRISGDVQVADLRKLDTCAGSASAPRADVSMARCRCRTLRLPLFCRTPPATHPSSSFCRRGQIPSKRWGEERERERGRESGQGRQVFNIGMLSSWSSCLEPCCRVKFMGLLGGSLPFLVVRLQHFDTRNCRGAWRYYFTPQILESMLEQNVFPEKHCIPTHSPER